MGYDTPELERRVFDLDRRLTQLEQVAVHRSSLIAHLLVHAQALLNAEQFQTLISLIPLSPAEVERLVGVQPEQTNH